MNPIIQLNSNGESVTEWQQFLSSQGYAVGGADGIFGPATNAATQAFQKKGGLTTDGVVGPDTYAAAAALGFTGGAPRPATPIPIANFLGIDVYHDNGTIDWNAVKADPQNIHFVYVKATQGTTVQDPMYAANIQGATAAGFATGAYHFFSITSPAQSQADNFIQQVGDSYPYKLPPAFDYEVNVTSATAAGVLASIQTWLTAIKNKWGITPVIYSSVNYWGQLGNPPGFDEYPLWLANYNPGMPAIPGNWNEWAIWQYSSNGSVNGVTGDVDMNKYNTASNLFS